MGNRRVIHRHRRTELVQLHTAHRKFKGGTTELGAALGVLYEKLDIGTAFDKFREKLKGYVERNFENAKDVLCVVTDMEDPIKFLKRTLYRKIQMRRKENSILKKKRLELALTRYMDR